MINFTNILPAYVSLSAQQNSSENTIIVFLTYTGRKVTRQEDSIDRQMVEFANKIFPKNMAIENYDRWVYAVQLDFADSPEWIKSLSYLMPTIY